MATAEIAFWSAEAAARATRFANWQIGQGTLYASFLAAQATAENQWLAGVASSYVASATAAAQAVANFEEGLIGADAAKNNALEAMNVAFEAASEPLYALANLQQLQAKRVWAEAETAADNARFLLEITAEQAYDLALAFGVKSQGIAYAQAEKAYQVDLINLAVGGDAGALLKAHEVAFAGADLGRVTAGADGNVAWTTATAASRKTWRKGQADSDQTYFVELARIDRDLVLALAPLHEQLTLTAAGIDATYNSAAQSAASAFRTAKYTAIGSFESANLSVRATAVSGIYTSVDLPWVQEQATLAAAKSDWFLATGQSLFLAMGAAINAAETEYQNAENALDLARFTSQAAAERAYGTALAGINYAERSAAAGEDKNVKYARATSEESWQVATAAARRAEIVGSKTAERDYVQNGDASARTSSLATVAAAKSTASKTAALDFTLADATALGVRKSGEASLAKTRVNSTGAATATRDQAIAHSDQVFASGQAAAEATRNIAIYGATSAYEIGRSVGYAAAVGALAQNSGNPWLVRDAALFGALADYQTTSLTARQSFSVALENSIRDLVVTSSQAGETLAVALSNAETGRSNAFADQAYLRTLDEVLAEVPLAGTKPYGEWSPGNKTFETVFRSGPVPFPRRDNGNSVAQWTQPQPLVAAPAMGGTITSPATHLVTTVPTGTSLTGLGIAFNTNLPTYEVRRERPQRIDDVDIYGSDQGEEEFADDEDLASDVVTDGQVSTTERAEPTVQSILDKLAAKWRKPAYELVGEYVRGVIEGFKDGFLDTVGMGWWLAKGAFSAAKYAYFKTDWQGRLLRESMILAKVGDPIAAEEAAIKDFEVRFAFYAGSTAASAADLWVNRKAYAAKFAAQAADISAKMVTLKGQVTDFLEQHGEELITAILNGDTAKVAELKKGLPPELEKAVDTVATFALSIADMAADKLDAHKIGYLVGQLLYEAVEDAVISAAWAAITGVTVGAASPSAGPLVTARVANFSRKLASFSKKLGIADDLGKMIVDKVEAAIKWTARHVDDAKALEKGAAKAADAAKHMPDMSVLRKLGCFVAGTPVWLSAVPASALAIAGSRHSTWEDSAEVFDPAYGYGEQWPIEDVPLGSRVAARNPRPEDYDTSFPEPEEGTWRQIDFVISRKDELVVQISALRPAQWIEQLGLHPDSVFEVSYPDLKLNGLAKVLSIKECPPIAHGPGSVVTSRIVTHGVDRLVKVTFADGTGLVGTEIHPVWDAVRLDWTPLGKLRQGDFVLSNGELLGVSDIDWLAADEPVYNLETHGEHVYEAGSAAILVHNGNAECVAFLKELDELADAGDTAGIQRLWRKQGAALKKAGDLSDGQRRALKKLEKKYGAPATRVDPVTQDHHAVPWNNKTYKHQNHPLVKQAGNPDLETMEENLRALEGHSGRHSKAYHAEVKKRLDDAAKRVAGKGREAAQKALDDVIKKIWEDIASGKLRPYNHKDVIL